MRIVEEIEQEQRRLAFRNKWVNDFGVSLELAEALETIVDLRCSQTGYINAEELRALVAAEIRVCQLRKQRPSAIVRHVSQVLRQTLDH
jgi:hypothetical protein